MKMSGCWHWLVLPSVLFGLLSYNLPGAGALTILWLIAAYANFLRRAVVAPCFLAKLHLHSFLRNSFQAKIEMLPQQENKVTKKRKYSVNFFGLYNYSIFITVWVASSARNVPDDLQILDHIAGGITNQSQLPQLPMRLD